MRRADGNGPPAVSQNPGGRTTKNTATQRHVLDARVSDGSVNQPVVDKLWRLHADHGYFTRAEIEAALGLDHPPPGRWECPGQFGADGRHVRHCGGEPA